MSYSDYALIKKSTLTEIGDAIRSQKGTTELIDPANFGSEISAIEGGASIDGGYIVNFYNSDNKLIEFHGALFGYKINTPVSYSAEIWVDDNGTILTFPLIINESDNIALINSYAKDGSREVYLIDSKGTNYSTTFFDAEGNVQTDNTYANSADIMRKSYDTIYSLYWAERTNSNDMFDKIINCSSYNYLFIKYLYVHTDSYNSAKVYLAKTLAADNYGYISASNYYKTLSLEDSTLTNEYYINTYGEDYINNEEAYKWASISLEDVDSFYLAFHCCYQNFYIADVKLVE